MTRGLLLLPVVLAGAAAFGGGYRGIETDVSALPQEKAFLGRLVRSRVWERTVPVTYRTNRNLRVTFAIDGSLGGDNAVVTVKNGRAEVRGARFRALVAGAGVMLRSMRFGADSFELADGTYRFAPQKTFRQVYFARHFENWYHRASTDELVRYLEDLVLWGFNALHDPIAYPVCESLKATESDRADYRAASLALSRRADELDVDLTVSGGSNSGPRTMPAKYRSQHHYNGKGSTQYNICPELPDAMDYLLSLRRAHNEQCRGLKIAGCRYMPYDEGGCRCDKCYPWGGNGYVKLIERFRDLNNELNPHMKHIVSTWFFDKEDWERFYKYLETQDWIDCLMVDSGGYFPRYVLEHPVPKNIPVVTFPEISMYGRFPWGGTGANPQPARFEKLFRQAEPVAKGFSCYSEGIYEDLNKIIVNGLYVDPSRSTDSILAEYANYELPGAPPGDFVALVKNLESIYPMRIKGRTGIAGVSVALYLRDAPAAELKRRALIAKNALALSRRIDGEILPRCRHNWRWRQLFLRAQIDESIYRTRDIRNPDAMLAYGELIDLYHVHRQVEELYENTWGGFTAPPMMEQKRIRKAAAEFLRERNLRKEKVK